MGSGAALWNPGDQTGAVHKSSGPPWKPGLHPGMGKGLEGGILIQGLLCPLAGNPKCRRMNCRVSTCRAPHYGVPHPDSCPPGSPTRTRMPHPILGPAFYSSFLKCSPELQQLLLQNLLLGQQSGLPPPEQKCAVTCPAGSVLVHYQGPGTYPVGET